MKLLAVIMSLLILTTGCVAGESAQPVVQPQVTVEQPTYQGITQYDYKAGPPEYVAPPQADNTTQGGTTAESEPLQPTSSLPYYLNITGGGGGGGGGYWPPYYYTPPAPAPEPEPEPQPVTILSGSVTVTITGE